MYTEEKTGDDVNYSVDLNHNSGRILLKIH